LVFGINNKPCSLKRLILRVWYYESFKNILQNEPCLHSCPFGVTEILQDFVEKSLKVWKLYNYFIIISILYPKILFYNKCHKVSLYVSKAICLLFWSFGAKLAEF
jgi:hypothetical protein